MGTGSEDVTDTALDSLMGKAARALEPSVGTPLPSIGTVVADKFLLEAELGRGGMGAVYRARHHVTGKQFAIKWLLPNLSERPDAVQRFMREARVGGKFEHSNVVEVYDVGRHDNCHYIVMELVHGEPLATRLQRSGKLTVRETCRLLIPVMRGVHAAHHAGVIHRDLKPHNIILSRDEMGEDLPKVVDFGISKVLPRSEQAHTTETAEGTIIGTPEYMAPEQLRGHTVDARVDVYAVGVIAYQMLGGRLPFMADNRTDLVCKILSEPVTPLRTLTASVPAAVAAAIATAMERDPSARYPSMVAFARALEPFAAGMRFAPAAVSDEVRSTLESEITGPLPTPYASESPHPSPATRPALQLWAAGALSAALLALAAYLVIVRADPRDAAAPAMPVAVPTHDAPAAPAAPMKTAQPTAAGSPAPPAATAASEPVVKPKPTAATTKKKPAQAVTLEPTVAPPVPVQPAPDPHARPKPPPVSLQDFRP